MNRFIELFEELKSTKKASVFSAAKSSRFSQEKAISNFPTPKAIYEQYKKIYDGRFSNNKIINAKNECAVRLSWALGKLGVDISGSDEYRDVTPRTGSVPVQRSARALAKWLVKKIGKPKYLNILPERYQQHDFNGKAGIIYFVHKDRENGGNGPGHIDVIYNNDIGSRFYDNGKLWFWEFKDNKWVKN